MPTTLSLQHQLSFRGKAIQMRPKNTLSYFLAKTKKSKKERMKAILTDRRVSDVLPSPSTVTTNTMNKTTEGLSYNNQFIHVADITKCWP